MDEYKYSFFVIKEIYSTTTPWNESSYMHHHQRVLYCTAFSRCQFSFAGALFSSQPLESENVRLPDIMCNCTLFITVDICRPYTPPYHSKEKNEPRIVNTQNHINIHSVCMYVSMYVLYCTSSGPDQTPSQPRGTGLKKRQDSLCNPNNFVLPATCFQTNQDATIVSVVNEPERKSNPYHMFHAHGLVKS